MEGVGYGEGDLAVAISALQAAEQPEMGLPGIERSVFFQIPTLIFGRPNYLGT
jgi:hypothetical protein